VPSKVGYFTVIGWSSVKTVADRQRHAVHHNASTGFLVMSTSLTLNDLEHPKIGVLVIFGDFRLQKSELLRDGWR